MRRETERERRVVFRWLRRRSAEMLGPTLNTAYPPEQSDAFDEAIRAIDDSEMQVWGNGDPAPHRRK